MPSANHTIAEALSSAQSIIAEWIPPEGIDAEHAMAELVGVLDNRTLLAAQCAQAGPLEKGVDQDQLEARSKVTFDVLRKYGVLIDPESLSDEAIDRLYRRINYPRLSCDNTLREWSDAVLGEGEQVRFFLPQSPKRNTHLGTVQLLSGEVRAFIHELVESVEIEGDPGSKASSKKSEPAEDDFVLDVSAVRQQGFAINEEAEAITSGGQLGLNTLRALIEVSEDEQNWAPPVVDCIKKLLDAHGQDEEMDTLEAMTKLVGRFDVMVRKALEVLEKAKGQPA